MTKPIIVHQECFDTACSVIEGKQRFDRNLAMLFVDLAFHIAKCTSLDTGFPLRIEIELGKNLWDYCFVAKVYTDHVESE